MSFWYALDDHHASGIDHSRQALFLQYPWARSCMKCWRLVTFAKAKFWPDTFAFSLISLVRHILVGHVNICKARNGVPSYLARHWHCITQLLPILSSYWAPEIGQRNRFPIERKSWWVYRRMIKITITTVTIVITIITNDSNFFPEYSIRIQIF